MPLADFIGPLSGLGGATVGAVFTWLGTRFKTKTEAEDAARDNDREDVAAVDARWQSMLEQQRKDFELILKPIREDLDSVRREVAELRALYDRVRSLYRTSLDHIRELRAKWPSDRISARPDLPEPIRDDVL
ncbi:hypothetical protein QT969_10395 [Rhodococcus sp. CSLK01-03]|uniref:Uncharacterized protein n=1 Tax=Rhodococcus indonesiensis TaxID=3055869 RepID=A0ABT7RM33_9NOCA|nr:hypothetical protein [Rhodococcus indonesiensis]MDM7488700.1 hypothetical protein [Rhodococcus indonesiensis]